MPETLRIQSMNTEMRVYPSGNPRPHFQAFVHAAKPIICPFATNGLPESPQHTPRPPRANAQSVPS